MPGAGEAVASLHGIDRSPAGAFRESIRRGERVPFATQKPEMNLINLHNGEKRNFRASLPRFRTCELFDLNLGLFAFG